MLRQTMLALTFSEYSLVLLRSLPQFLEGGRCGVAPQERFSGDRPLHGYPYFNTGVFAPVNRRDIHQ